MAILDETDSGLDVDALKVVGRTLSLMKKNNPAFTVLLITHYQRFLDYVPVSRVAVMRDGAIVREGAQDVIDEIEHKGFAKL